MSAMSGPLLLDLTHTSHTRARTGVQRVARSLRAALGDAALPVTHDPFAGSWRMLRRWELANLAADAPGSRRGAHWPLAARLHGRLRRLTGGAAADATGLAARSAAGLVVPEIFAPATAAAFPALGRATAGPRVAVFHDALALQFPELAPPRTVARFPGYLRELLAFDGIAAVSEDSRRVLLDYWKWAGFADAPPVVAIPLGIAVPAAAPPPPPPGPDPTLLCVGSLEARKNHLALLEACERLWTEGARFSLHVIGLAQAQTGAPALARLQHLQQAGRPLRYDGPVGEAALEQAYADCTLTVYPSLAEGFGLPVLESLARGRPCICSNRGALGESARGGGVLGLDAVDAASLAAGLRRLLRSPSELDALTRAARARTFRTWTDYGADLRSWMATLALD